MLCGLGWPKERIEVRAGNPAIALEVDCKAALVAVEGSEETGAEPAEATGMVTVGRGLDLDHVGAELGEDEPGGNSIKKEGTPILFDRVYRPCVPRTSRCRSARR